MTRDIDELLRSTTPGSPRFDLEALHRRGVRRRRRARAGVAGGLVALIAVATLAQGSTFPDVTIEPAGPGETDGAAPHDDPVDRSRDPEDGSLPFGVTDAEVAAMAARLPDPDAGTDDSDADLVRGTDLGGDPYLRTEDIHCVYLEGGEASIDVAEDGRVRASRFGSDMTFEDVVTECLDSDMVRSREWHAPGPFTFCAASVDPAAREEMRNSVPGGRERSTLGSGSEPLPFIAALSYEADCSTALPEPNPSIVLHGPASLEPLNDHRRVEVAMKAIEWGCLDGREAVSLAAAAADRLGGEWQLDTPADLELPTTRPCWGLTLDLRAATLSVHPGGYWDREEPRPTPLENDDPRVDADSQANLVGLLGADDPDALAAAVDQVAGVADRWLTAQDLLDSALLDPPPAPGAARLAEQVAATGCLTTDSAIALASAAREVLRDLDPDADWFIGEISEHQVTGNGPPTPPADCLELHLAYEEDGPDDHRRPALVLAPAWIR